MLCTHQNKSGKTEKTKRIRIFIRRGIKRERKKMGSRKKANAKGIGNSHKPTKQNHW